MSREALLRAGVAIFAVLAILAMLVGGFLFDFLLSLNEPYAGTIRSPSGLSNYVGVLHTFLFRNAVTNTLLLTLVVVPLSVLLGMVLANSLALSRFDHRAALGLLLIPLFVPPSVAALAWRVPLADMLAMRETNPALFVIGVVLLWRTFPLATGILYFARRQRYPWRPYLIAALTVTGVVLLDASGALMLTGGEPSNTSQTWASWLIQNVWVNRNWGQAAAMSIPLAAAVAFVAAGLAWFTIAGPISLRPSANSDSYASHLHTLIILLGGAFILAPALFALRPASATPASGFDALLRAGFAHWMANTLLVVTGTALGAALLILMAVPQIARLPARARQILGAAALIAGVASLPIWLVPLVWLQDGGLLSDGRLALSIVFGTTIASLSLWPSAMIWRQTTPRLHRSTQIIGLTGALSLLCVFQDFGNVVAVNESSRTALLGSGIALYLARSAAAPSALALATLLIFALAGVCSVSFCCGWRRFSRSYSLWAHIISRTVA